MASYATVPAADLESEATLLNSKPKTKTSLLVGGVAAAAFVLGVLSMTALRTSPSVRSAAFDANTGRTDPINIILFGSKERAETPNGMCLDIPDVENIQLENGIGLQIWECGEWNAGWVASTVTNPEHRFLHMPIIEWQDSGFCVDACSGGEGGWEGQQLCLWECDKNGARDQQWFWDDVNRWKKGQDVITLQNSNYCMDVAGGDVTTNGTPVQAWDCFTDDGADSEQNQQWVFTCPAEGDCGNQV